MTVFFQLAGGVALILFGIRFLRKGLERLFGGRLVAWMARLTERRWKAFGAGVVVGTLAPSSTALSLLTLQMLHAGKLTAERMLAVLLGANVGITVMVQLLAFHVQDFAGLFLVLGVIGFQFLNREGLRGVGQCLLAFGFVFLAMQLIGDGASALGLDPASLQWMALFAGHPLVTFLFVAGLTVVVQSSTASIGFAIALAAGGLFSPDLVLPWVLGTNIGVSLTGLLAGWSTLEGRRLAMANLLVKLVVAVPFIAIPSLIPIVMQWLPGSLARELAVVHTGFNLLVGLLAVPCVGPITRLVQAMIVPRETSTGLPEVTSFLDPQSLQSPSLALANATRETQRMADGVKTMLQFFWRSYTTRSPELMMRVQQEDDRVDGCYRGLKDYLSRIQEEMSEDEKRWQFVLLGFSNELESVGDLIDKNLCDLLRKQFADGTVLPPVDADVLAEAFNRVASRFDVALLLLSSRGGAQARAFVSGKEALNDWCRRAQREHYERLRMGQGDMAGSAYFLDMLDGLRRINSHISSIGYEFTSTPKRRARTAHERANPVPDANPQTNP